MNEGSGLNVISIDVTLEQTNGRIAFRYQGADEASRRHVDGKGNIDLAGPQSLARGPVDLLFRLQTPQVTLDDTPHNSDFAAADSIWIGEAARGTPKGPYRAGVLGGLGLKRPQFHGYSHPEARHLRLSNRNDDGKEYKYTLRVRASAGGNSRWLEDDPRIKNTGGSGSQ